MTIGFQDDNLRNLLAECLSAHRCHHRSVHGHAHRKRSPDDPEPSSCIGRCYQKASRKPEADQPDHSADDNENHSVDQKCHQPLSKGRRLRAGGINNRNPLIIGIESLAGGLRRRTGITVNETVIFNCAGGAKSVTTYPTGIDRFPVRMRITGKLTFHRSGMETGRTPATNLCPVLVPCPTFSADHVATSFFPPYRLKM